MEKIFFISTSYKHYVKILRFIHFHRFLAMSRVKELDSLNRRNTLSKGNRSRAALSGAGLVRRISIG
jgi:hypothetical protein